MTATRNRRLPLLGRLAPVVGLLAVSPIAAEHLSGYQVFNPLVLLSSLGIFIPLYGMVAVLIREITRRTGRGWPTILLLVAAGPLVATVAASFFVVDPLGDASSAERYLSNTILLAGSSPCWRRRGAGPAGHNRVSPPLMNPTAAAAGS